MTDNTFFHMEFLGRLERQILVKGYQGKEEDLEKESGIHTRTIANWQLGEIPEVPDLLKLCKVLGVNARWLVLGAGDKTRPPKEPPDFLQSMKSEYLDWEINLALPFLSAKEKAIIVAMIHRIQP